MGRDRDVGAVIEVVRGLVVGEGAIERHVEYLEGVVAAALLGPRGMLRPLAEGLVTPEEVARGVLEHVATGLHELGARVEWREGAGDAVIGALAGQLAEMAREREASGGLEDLAGELRVQRIRNKARRLLAGTRQIFGGPIFPGYTSFEGAGRPVWWRDERVESAWGEALGVHEVERGSREGAFIVTTLGLALLSTSGRAEWIPYRSIEGYEQLCKEPISRALVLKLEGGRRVAIPFQPDGEAFTFARFVMYARGEVLREAESASR